MNNTDELKISEMEEAEELKNEDLVMIVQDGINKKVKASRINSGALMVESVLKLVFPIGSTYVTQAETNPNEILGFGTWERLRGKVCLGLDEEDSDMNEIGKTGGEKKHTLTIAEMPSHNHSTSAELYALKPKGGTQESGAGGATSTMIIVNNTGGGQAHNNIQPYEVVGYMWIRRL